MIDLREFTFRSRKIVTILIHSLLTKFCACFSKDFVKMMQPQPDTLTFVNNVTQLSSLMLINGFILYVITDKVIRKRAQAGYEDAFVNRRDVKNIIDRQRGEIIGKSSQLENFAKKDPRRPMGFSTLTKGRLYHH